MKTVLGSMPLTVVCIFLMVQCVAAESTLSFFATTWNNKSSSWVKDANIFPREDVRLECTTTKYSQVSEHQIKRADGYPLSIYSVKDIQRRETRSLVLMLRSVGCNDTGTYVCENGQGDKMTVDIGIYDCPPRPCKDQNIYITLHASVNETKQFSVCVEAFPDVGSLAFDGEKVGFDATNGIVPGVNCTKKKTEDVFSTYNILCQIKVGDEISYGVHDFSISSGAASTKKVSFALQVEKPGPPVCPMNINSTRPGRDSVTLSWQPVKKRGGSQPVTYTVFYTSNDTEWQRYRPVEGTQATITDLMADTSYEFRVASANEYSQAIDQNTCDITVVVKTEKYAKATTEAKPSLLKNKNNTDSSTISPVNIYMIIVVVLAVAIAVLGFYFHSRSRRKRRQRQNTTQDGLLKREEREEAL